MSKFVKVIRKFTNSFINLESLHIINSMLLHEKDEIYIEKYTKQLKWFFFLNLFKQEKLFITNPILWRLMLIKNSNICY
jgi:hypothetical protein